MNSHKRNLFEGGDTINVGVDVTRVPERPA